MDALACGYCGRMYRHAGYYLRHIRDLHPPTEILVAPYLTVDLTILGAQ